MCEPYEELDGEMFAKFVKKHFPIAFRRSCQPLKSRQLLARQRPVAEFQERKWH